MRRCSVPGCFSNYTKPYVSVFTFPKDPTLCKLWLKSMGRPALKVHENIGVCIKHFEKHLICGMNSSDRKKLSIKPGAVPTIFEDVCSSDDSCKMLQKVKSLDNFPRMQGRKSKSSPGAVPNSPCRQDGERKGSFKSPKKSTTTTDRPFVTVIKAEDLIMESDKSPEKIDDQEEEDEDENNDDEDDDDYEEEEEDEEEEENSEIEIDDKNSGQDSHLFNLPSPFKNLPNVSVCLKEEDRVPITKELKGVKRSPSTGSNSSTGSSEAQKLNTSLTKRRKVEKPAPVVIGRQNDCYCWVCHRENITLCCIACPRAYHTKCAGEQSAAIADWVCPECQKILQAENVDTRSSTLAEISLDKLGALLKLSLNKMKQRAPIAFHQPVSLEHYPLYLHYVIHPMDFSLLEKNIKQKVYGCTEAFLADVKWISHNSCVFNGTQHPLSTNAKNLVKSCDQDMQEIEVCPDCFVHSIVRNKYWFSEVCRKPHPLVWAKLKGFPYWPAKVVRIIDGNVDARFFGAHDRAWVPVSQCYHLSKEMPTTSKPKKKGNYEVALDELNVHVHLLIQKFGCFEYATPRTSFNPQNKYLMYHGIDIDKVAKEEISFDTSSPIPDKFHSSEKENRFASFLESEHQKLSQKEMKLSDSCPEKPLKSPTKVDDEAKSPFHFSERKSMDSVFSEKETTEDETNQGKKTLEDKTNDQTKTAEEKTTNTSQVSPVKISEKVSASDQFRKLELALERIKGYVSLTAESENENGESQNEDQEESKESEESKEESKEVEKDESKRTTFSSPLFKETIKLPEIETSNVQESEVDVSKSLETKKTDSFFLKLNETIESCKAKLGISEVTDDLSDESCADENASRSDDDDDEDDDDEEDNSSASEADEESSDDEDEEEEDEVMEVSGDEVENGDDDVESSRKAEEMDDEENSESDEESNSESSCTDIESHVSEASPKKDDNSYMLSSENIDNTDDISCNDKNVDSVPEDNCKDTNNSVEKSAPLNSDIGVPCLDVQVPEVPVDDSGALEVIGDITSSDLLTESSTDVKETSSNKETENFNEMPKKPLDGVGTPSKDDSCSIVIEDSADESMSSPNLTAYKNNEKSAKTVTESLHSVEFKTGSALFENNMENKHDDGTTTENEGTVFSENLSSVPCKNETVEEDDDIYICTPTRPKSPPVIVLDDDVENEDSSVSDTNAIKSPPYSTSAESFSSEEVPANKPNSGDEESDFSSSKTVSVNGMMAKEKSPKDMNATSNSVPSSDRRKRKLSSADSSDDEIQIVSPVKRPYLTGAKRTFNKPSTVETAKRVSPTLESVKRNLVKEGLEKAKVATPPTKLSEGDAPSLRSEPTTPVLSPQNTLRSPVIDTSNLSDQEKEILYLKRKLNCLMTAYKIQGWKCHQEREELRHNMNLSNMEMRASLESDKKLAIEALTLKFEQEKQKSIEEAKRKQWCACCLMESRYVCCWNTSYCSTTCQKRHFNEHKNFCSQLKKNIEVKANSTPTVIENNENKKVFIVNMKSDAGKSIGDRSVSLISPQTLAGKHEIPILPKSTLQIASSVSSSNPVQSLPLIAPSVSSSNPVLFVLAPVKPASDPVVTTVSSSSLNVIEKNLDSAKIISQVRNKTCDAGAAVSLLKKKNLESALSVLAKKKEQKAKEESTKEDTNLEEVYFPSPPKITFEGYDSATPDPNLVIHETEEAKEDPAELEIEELNPEECPVERDIVFSDTDEMDNEMVNIGHCVEVKAKFLNKCLVYGQTAKKLTRCLVDIVFPDIKLLAACSAFGLKSNVTKLTRAALPARKVHAIIDYVTKRFPFASRSELVLAINMKCKEARIMLNRRESHSPKKTMIRRSLAREQEDELASTETSNPATAATSSPTIISNITSKSIPNVVCVKSSSSQHQTLPFNPQKKQTPGPNILRCSPQPLMVRPKTVFNQPPGNVAYLQPSKKRETVRELLSKNKNLSAAAASQDGPQIVLAVDANKQSVMNTSQPINLTPPSSSSTNVRPYIIIGSQVNTSKALPPVQSPAQPVLSSIKK